MRSLCVTAVLRGTMACVAASMFLSGCEGGTTPDSPSLAPASKASSAAVKSLDLSPSQLRLVVGDTVLLSAVPRGPSGKPASTPVTFTSSAPSVATVSSTGRVVAVGIGSAVITAQSGGITAISTVQVFSFTTVANIAVQSISLDTGQTAPLSYTVLNPDGKALTGLPATFVAGAPDIASVSADGVVRGVSYGQTTVSITVDTVTRSLTVTVAPPPVSGADGANEPAGFSSITNRAFNSLATNCSDVVSAEGWEPSEECAWHHISIIQDPTAPRSPNNVLQAWYPAGTAGGTTNATPGRIVKNFTSSQQMYISIWVELSANWIGNGTGTNKVFYVWMNNSPDFFMSAEGSGSGQLVATGRYQGPLDSRGAFSPNLASAPVPRGAWQHWEVLMKANTPGASNGEFHLWVNGVKVSQYTNIGYLSSRATVALMKMDVEPIWGGAGSTLAAEQFMYVDNVYVSVK